jgi:hypothetical protein
VVGVREGVAYNEGDGAMTREEHARQLRLVTGSEQRETGTARHGCYALRRKPPAPVPTDEEATQARLYGGPRERVDNVRPIRPAPEPPRAA